MPTRKRFRKHQRTKTRFCSVDAVEILIHQLEMSTGFSSAEAFVIEKQVSESENMAGLVFCGFGFVCT